MEIFLILAISDVFLIYYYYLKRLAMQGREREIEDTLSVRRPQPHTTNQ